MYTVTPHLFKSTPSRKVYLGAGELMNIAINNAKEIRLVISVKRLVTLSEPVSLSIRELG